MPGLFVDESTGRLRAGSGTRLDNDPSKWQEQILQDLAKNHPFLGNYQQALEILSSDQQRGYMYGHVTLSPPSLAQVPVGRMTEPASPEKLVQVPFVVDNFRLKAMDIFLADSGQFYPLTEARISQTLQEEKPGVMAPAPAVPAGSPNFGRPQVSNETLGAQGGGFNEARTASALLERIAPTIDPEDQRRFLQAVQSDPFLLSCYAGNEAFTKCAHVIDTAHPRDPRAQQADIDHALPADVVQFKRMRGGYLMKSANAEAFSPREEFIDRKYAGAAFPEGVLKRLLVGETPTFARAPMTKEASAPPATFAPIEKFAACRAMTQEGPVQGWAIPGIWDPDRDVSARGVLLVSPEGHRYCEELAVDATLTKEAAAPELPNAPPHGYGCFVRVDNAGVPCECTRPLRIMATLPHEDSVHYAADYEGVPVRVVPTDALAKFAAVDGTWLVPRDTCFFMPLVDKALPEPLDGETHQTRVEYEKNAASLALRSDGQRFYFTGGVTGTLSTEFRDNVERADTLFLLGAYGLDESAALAKMAEAAAQGLSIVPVARMVTTYAIRKTAASQEATRLYEEVRPRITKMRANLVKLAAQIPDADTVDKVLSLGFVNPENLSTFAENAPELENSLSNMCELLLLSRLGERRIPEEALQQGIHQMDSVLDVLRNLSGGDVVQQGAAA